MSTDAEKAHEARTPTEIDRIAEDWVTTLADLDPSVATWIGIPGRLDDYEDLSPAGHEKLMTEARAVLEKMRSATPADDVDWVTKTDLINELELAVVLRKSGKWFSPEEAADYIGGYVIFNDITARDIQRREMRSGVFSFCKAIDTFCPLGPWIVTPDEIPDPHDLKMELRVPQDTTLAPAGIRRSARATS